MKYETYKCRICFLSRVAAVGVTRVAGGLVAGV